MEVALILKLVTIGADLLNNGTKAYLEHKDEFSSNDRALIEAALQNAYASNDAKAAKALLLLDEAAKS